MKISMRPIRLAIQIALIGILTQGYSQSLPNRMNYQAVARDNAGNIMTSKPVRLKLEITDSAGTTAYYSESHPVTTNAQGLINVQIGGGTPITGNYATIPWSGGRKYLRTSMDATGGTNYLLLGSSELLAVPYALYALNAGGMPLGSVVPSKQIRDSLYKDLDGFGLGYMALDKLDSVAINANNIAIGPGAGANLTASSSVNTNNDNLLFGVSTGFSLGSTGGAGESSNNIMMGNYAGQYMNGSAYANVIIGSGAARFAEGLYNGKGGFNANVAIGQNAMQYIKYADANVSIGLDNMISAPSAFKSVSIGAWSAVFFTGDQNVILGAQTADGQGAKGNKNVIIGANAAKLIQGDRNVIIGSEAVQSGVGSNDNVAVGYQSLVNNQAPGNTAVGALTLTSNTSGPNNVAVGVSALSRNVSGSRNVAVGVGALENNQASVNNAVGYLALLNNTTGFENNAFGHQALEQNTSGNGNTGFGHNVMQLNKTGSSNTAIGYMALQKNLASLNSALGHRALGENSTGSLNTAMGTNSLVVNTTGRQLTAVGFSAGETNTTGSDNVYIGAFAKSETVVSNSTALGTNARVSTSNTMSFGSSLVNKWAFGLATTPHALQVGSNTTNGNGAYLTVGGTWTNASSRHFKENFQEISDQDLLDRLRSLEITQWNYKGTEETHIGPMAEQFSDMFGLGVKGDREHISTIDMSGVALRAIQALMNLNNMQERKIEQLEGKLAELEQRLLKLEKLSGQ